MAQKYSPPNLPITVEGVRAYVDGDGTVMLKLRDCAIGLGLTRIAESGNLVIRWERVRRYLIDIKFMPIGGHADDDAAATSEELKESYIPEPYFYLLAMKADSEIARAFREKVAFKILPEIRRTGSYVSPSPTTLPAVRSSALTVAIDDMGTVAQQIEGIFGAERGIALSKAMTLVEQSYGVDLGTLRDLLPPAKGDVGLLNPTELGNAIGKSAIKVNRDLTMLGLQEKAGDGWQLTDAGREYGEMMPYTRNGHSGYRPLWRTTVLTVLKGGVLDA